MTRLTSDVLKPIPRALPRFDEELKAKIGASLLEVAIRASRCSAAVGKTLSRHRAAVIPITSGLGIIEGFAEAVAFILSHLGLHASVTQNADFEGFVEALQGRCHLIFAADDHVFAGMNVGKFKVVDNSQATGRGYAAALELKLREAKSKSAAVIGVGKVGSAAVEYLSDKGFSVYVYDLDSVKAKLVKGANPRKKIYVCGSVEECFSKARGILLAAPAANLVTGAMVNEDTVIAAPGIPLGLTEEAMRRLPEGNLIHEPLMLGVAVMAVELLKP